MPHSETSCGPRLTLKGVLFPSFFLSLFCFFSLKTILVTAASNFNLDVNKGQSRQNYSGCPDCGVGGTCVPNISLTFGDLLKYYHSSDLSLPHRCDCFEGYSGLLCNVKTTNVADNTESREDDFFPDDFFHNSDDCSLDCQNGGRCISIFGGLSYACVCVEPYWGIECEFDGRVEPCALDCSSIVNSISSSEGGDGDNGISQTRPGSFCVESSPTSNLENGAEDLTCIHCAEMTKEEEPDCEDLIDCKNGGVCKIDYQFVNAIASNSSKPNELTTERPWKCSSTTVIATNDIIESAKEIVWMGLPPYVLSCECQVGFQGETCEEIDVCGGCQNDGYCISKATQGDEVMTDDFWDFVNISETHHYYSNILNDGNEDDNGYINNNYGSNIKGWTDESLGEDDDYPIGIVATDSDCTCNIGGCDQTSCGIGTSCVGGMCNQNYLVSPMCPGGKCSQRHTANATCFGGDCDQTSAVGATCSGSDCFFDDIDAQTMPPNTDTMVPQFVPFCSCKYGYFGDLCQHEITNICLFEEGLGFNQVIHEICLKAGGFCPFKVGDRFCANGGKCNYTGHDFVSTKPDTNDNFHCDCLSGNEGLHCENDITPAPTLEPTAEQPMINKLSSSASIPKGWIFFVFALLFTMLHIY